MTLSELANLSEIVGSIGVVVSLVYLAIQIREQNSESRAGATNALTQQWAALMSDLATSESLGDIFFRGINDFHSLNPGEKMRFTTYLSQVAQITEALQNHYLEGRLDREIWGGFETRMNDVFSNPGVKTWWELRRHWFSPRIRKYFDDIVATSKEPKGYESFHSAT